MKVQRLREKQVFKIILFLLTWSVDMPIIIGEKRLNKPESPCILLKRFVGVARSHARQYSQEAYHGT